MWQISMDKVPKSQAALCSSLGRWEAFRCVHLMLLEMHSWPRKTAVETSRPGV